MSFDLLEPILNIVKSHLFGAVIHQNDAHCTLVVGLCNCSEALLACCVPNLKFHALVLHIDRLDFEVDSYYKQTSITLSKKAS